MRDNGVDKLIASVADPDTFVPWVFDCPDPPVVVGDYLEEVDAARTQTGHEESVVAGECLVAGQRMALICSDFDFLAGSVGRRACAIVISAFARAQELGLPLLASPSSGGTRMQEGTAAFVLMADVAAAVTRYRRAGNPVITWLRHPTTGGVMATWGSLGTITLGEPDALAGFLGPRVFQMLTGEPFPAGVQTTENLAAHGVIDQVVPMADLRDYLTRVLTVVASRTPPDVRRGAPVLPTDSAAEVTGLDPWDAVLSTRRDGRPGVLDVLVDATDVVRLSGTAEGERSDAVVLALALFGGRPAVVIGQDRTATDGLNPAAMRTARRGIRLAEELELPIVTVIDTAGGELSVAAEQGAMAGEIARCLSELTAVPVPTISVLLGMGCGGGALALLPADRVLASQRAWMSPLPLEGASIIRHRTPDRAPEMARAQQVLAGEMAANGIVDVIVPEYPDAADEPAAFSARVASAICVELARLTSLATDDRLATRRARYSGGVT